MRERGGRGETRRGRGKKEGGKKRSPRSLMAEGGISFGNSSILAAMDGESGDSSSEPHVNLIPNVDDSENNRKPLNNTCDPSEQKTPLEPTDFSLKSNNSLSRFCNYDPVQRTSEPKGPDLLSKEPDRTTASDSDRENATEKDVSRKDSFYRESRIADYLNDKDHFRDFRNNLSIVSSESGVGLTKEQHIRASEFATALNYNKDPHRTSDIAGMIFQHHQRYHHHIPAPKFIFLSFFFFLLRLVIFYFYPTDSTLRAKGKSRT